VPDVGIVVANNTSRNGLAAVARSRFEDDGWNVTDVTNFRGGVQSTCAYYSPSNPAYKRAAELLRKEFPAIKRIKPRFSRLPSAPIVVIVTRDYH
jgi:hypothetical protein